MTHKEAIKTYTQHRCRRHHRTGAAFMKCAWPSAIVANGPGEYALIGRSPGAYSTISMHPTLEAAERAHAKLLNRPRYEQRYRYDVVHVALDAQTAPASDAHKGLVPVREHIEYLP